MLSMWSTSRCNCTSSPAPLRLESSRQSSSSLHDTAAWRVARPQDAQRSEQLHPCGAKRLLTVLGAPHSQQSAVIRSEVAASAMLVMSFCLSERWLDLP